MNYDDIRLEIADNGLVLSYCEIMPRQEGDKDCCYNPREYRKRVYTFEQGESAIAEMRKMQGTNKAYPMPDIKTKKTKIVEVEED